MTRAELYTRLHLARFEHVPQAQLEQFINEAARELTLDELWPWRRASQTGAAPLTVTGLGQVDNITDPEQRVLWPRRRSELVESGYNLSEAGQGLYYWTQGELVSTYPVAASITVHHFSTKAWSVGTDEAANDADTPYAPARWHYVIELIARRKAQEFDKQFDPAQVTQKAIDRGFEQMRQAELPGYDEPDVVRVSEVY